MNEVISSWNELAGVALSRLWQASWQGALVFSAAWLLTRGRWWPAALRCWVWRLAYLKLLLLLIWTSPIELPLLRSHAPALQAEIPTDFVPPALSENLSALETADGPNASSTSVASSPRFTWPSVLLLLWLAGVMVVVARSLSAYRTIRRSCQRSRLLEDAEVIGEARALCDALALRRPPELRVTSQAAGPQVTGVFHPRILLPQHCLESRGSLRLLLAHELVHVRRRDLLWNWLPLFVRTLLFFHPLVWLAQREWLLCQEVACDERVVELTQTPTAEYGRLLVEVASSGVSGAERWMAVGVAESKTALRERLIAMKQYAKLTLGKRLIVISSLGAIALVGLVPWKLVAQTAPPVPPPPAAPPAPPVALTPGVPKQPGYSATTPRPGRRAGAANSFYTAAADQAPVAPPAAPGLPPIEPSPAPTTSESQINRAEINALEAELKAAQARMRAAEARWARTHDLKEQQVISDSDVEDAQAALMETRAQVARREADLAARKVRASADPKDQMIEELRSKIQQLQRQLAAQNTMPVAPAPPSTSRLPMNDPDQLALLKEEAALAEQQLEMAQKRYESGNASLDSVLQVRRDLYLLRRQLAESTGDEETFRGLVDQERKTIAELVDQLEKKGQSGEPVDADLLALRRRLLALERDQLSRRPGPRYQQRLRSIVSPADR